VKVPVNVSVPRGPHLGSLAQLVVCREGLGAPHLHIQDHAFLLAPGFDRQHEVGDIAALGYLVVEGCGYDLACDDSEVAAGGVILNLQQVGVGPWGQKV
jgi:hypothetical protein